MSPFKYYLDKVNMMYVFVNYNLLMYVVFLVFDYADMKTLLCIYYLILYVNASKNVVSFEFYLNMHI